MRLDFPTKGLNTGTAVEDQPLQTSPALMNVRPTDVAEDRVRGGQRPGLVKAFTTQITDVPGNAHPVIAMCQITSTYINPS